MTEISINPVKGRKVSKPRTRFKVRKKVLQNLDIDYVYSRRAWFIKGNDKLLAVRNKEGLRGWVDKETETFTSERDVGRLLRSIDYTTAGMAMGTKLEEAWKNMTAKQRLELWDRMRTIDWEDLWEDKYQDDKKRSKFRKTVAKVKKWVDELKNI